MMLRFLLLTLLSSGICFRAQCAFPLHAVPAHNIAAVTDSPALSAAAGHPIVRYADGVPQVRRHKVVYKSRSTASLLAFIGIYPLYGTLLGMQRLYLGYIPEGIIQMVAPWAGVAAIVVGVAAATTSPVYLAGIILGSALIAGAVLWHISDYIRIRMRTLRPKWGYYDDDVTRMRYR